MRYFIIGYNYKFGFGSCVIESRSFPSIKFIQEANPTVANLVPITFFEFKNKEDRDAYIEGSPKEVHFK